MQNILFDYYFSLFEVLVILFLVGGAGLAVLWGVRVRWWNRLKPMERKDADDLVAYGGEHMQALHEHLQSAIAHDFQTGLDCISAKGAQILEGLGDKQDALRDKLHLIVATACELEQHARNMVSVFASGQGAPKQELLNVRRSVEHVLLARTIYAESKGVTLRQDLADVEPTALDRILTEQVLGIVIENGIKYSYPGGVVETVLSLKSGMLEGTEKAICVDVKDTGQGIAEEDHDRIFELRVRGSGVVEPGSGLGLYWARKAARCQGGDVLLERSSLNEGAVFRVLLPYSDDRP